MTVVNIIAQLPVSNNIAQLPGLAQDNTKTFNFTQSPPALRVTEKKTFFSTEIAKYLWRLRNNIDHGHSASRDALLATEKKFPLILDRGSQSYLSWFIVSLL